MRNNNNSFTSWEPRIDWLILLPSRTATKHGSLYIPESIAKKANSGICIKAGDQIDEGIYLEKECFFVANSEYVVNDSETGWTLYIVQTTHIIMVRQPPQDVARFSREKVVGLSFEEIRPITHDQSTVATLQH